MATIDAEGGAAIFSLNRQYRYTLTRQWDSSRGLIAWVGLNPSTADEHQLDPTLRRVRDFSARWGFGGFVMLNLFAFRATDPREMMAAEEPVGVTNDDHLRWAARDSLAMVAAWGAHGNHARRAVYVRRVLEGELGHHDRLLLCLGTTKAGHPRHPLYVRGDTIPTPL